MKNRYVIYNCIAVRSDKTKIIWIIKIQSHFQVEDLAIALIATSDSPGIIKEIESEKKYFDFYLNRENCILYENNLVKDISLIGRDISKVIIIDDDENCFKLNKENGIKIGAFNEGNKVDNVLFELKKILILIHKKDYEDVRIAIKDFSNDIKSKVSLD